MSFSPATPTPTLPPIPLEQIVIALVLPVLWTCLSLLIVYPFGGAVIRLRAQYAPKSVALEGDERRPAPFNPLSGLFATLQRTMALEGWSGLYKGLYPRLLTFFICSSAVLTLRTLVISVQRGPASPGFAQTLLFEVAPRLAATIARTRSTPPPPTRPPEPSFKEVLVIVVFTQLIVLGVRMLLLPMAVVSNRAVVTPYRLPFSIRRSLRLLLTPHERAAVYRLYLIPGVAAAVLVMLLLDGLIHVVAFVVLDWFMRDDSPATLSGDLSTVLLKVVSTLWVVPLKVVINKLTVQGALRTGDEKPADSAAPRASSTDDDVVNLRPALPKYAGLGPAFRTIVLEEGWQALYRGWIWTALGLVLFK